MTAYERFQQTILNKQHSCLLLKVQTTDGSACYMSQIYHDVSVDVVTLPDIGECVRFNCPSEDIEHYWTENMTVSIFSAERLQSVRYKDMGAWHRFDVPISEDTVLSIMLNQ